jgi:hypothetical protein
VQCFNGLKKCGLWMITVLVILWYGNGNQVDGYIKAKRLVIKYTNAICGRFINEITQAAFEAIFGIRSFIFLQWRGAFSSARTLTAI